MIRAFACLLVVAALAAAPARAQEEAPDSATPTLKRTEAVSQEERLIDLSKVLGALHHLVPLCDPGAGERWRDRMMELIRLERPATGQKNAMVAAFNAAFADASETYPSCTDETRNRSRGLSEEGEALARALSNRL